MPSLIVRDVKNGRVKEIELSKKRFTIGKSDWNDLVLPRDDVSREHCVLFQKDEAYFLRDLSSRRGTLIDGQAISDDVKLDDGVRFEVGGFEVQFRLARQKTTREHLSSADGIKAGASLTKAPAGSTDAWKALKAHCHRELLESKELKRVDFETIPEEQARQMTDRVLVRIIKDLEDKGRLAGFDRRKLLKEVGDEALGLGPLEDLLRDDNISEIMVNNADTVFIETRDRGMVLSDTTFTSNEQVMHVIRRILAPIGRRINEQTPLVDGRLLDGSRVNAIIPPLAVSGPSLTIRKFPKDRLAASDLVRFGSMSNEMAKFLELAVRERLNICISGGTGSGKTTLLNVVSNFIREGDRIVTVEDVSELKLNQPHVVTLEARQPNLEGEGAITIRDLLKNCLRMRPDRIIVGECRGGEALDMLQAMNTGHDGSLTTIHSNSPRDCIARIETLVLFAGTDLPSKAIREQIASAVHLIVQQTRLHDGSRKVTYITEVTGMEGGVVTMQDVFLFNQKGFDENHKVLGEHAFTGNMPKFVQALRRRGVDVDMSMFQRPEADAGGGRRRR
ncbi:MAG: ATPase, T2SS/T4P/T4SS family [Planctomycetota bacterium]